MPAIGVITFELRLNDAHSLKDKRHYVKGLKDRLRTRVFNVAVSEIGYQDSWKLGLVAGRDGFSKPGICRTGPANGGARSRRLARPLLVDTTVEWLS